MLQHFVSKSVAAMRELQVRALRAWHDRAQAVFAREYIRESFPARMPGLPILRIARIRLLLALTRVMPASKRRAFGIGERTRLHDQGVRLFALAGCQVRGSALNNLKASRY
jgi:hypothetical protein